MNLLLALRKIFWIFTKFAYLQIMRILCFVVLYIAIARLATILSVVGIKIYNCRIKSGMCKGLLNFHSLVLKFRFFPQLQYFNFWKIKAWIPYTQWPVFVADLNQRPFLTNRCSLWHSLNTWWHEYAISAHAFRKSFYFHTVQ